MALRIRNLLNSHVSSEPADFYVAGGTLRADAPSYIPRQADEDLYAALSRGEFCYVLTSRQMGKSSLMVRTAARLRQDDVTVVVLDLTSYGQNVTPEQWYFSLLTTVGQRLDIEDELDDFWADNESLTPLHRWMEACRQVVLERTEGRVVVFVDEIDVVQSLPFSTGEFFAGIRECYTRRAQDPEFERITFCLVGVATPSDLIEDPLTTPFNIGTRIDLGDFQAHEAAGLAEGLGREQTTAAQLVGRILHWTGGHPYLTQRLCAAVASDATVTNDNAVDRLCSDLFFSERAQEQDDNLLFVRNQMLHRDMDHASLLNLYEQVRRGKDVRYDETNPLVNVLRLAGIARVDGGAMSVRNRIYEHVFDHAWVRESMPDAEARRQKAAFVRGILRAGAVAAVILAVIAGARVRTLAQARVDQGSRLLETEDQAGLLYLEEATRLRASIGLPTEKLARKWALWNSAHEGRLSQVLVAGGDVRGAAFSPDGAYIAVAAPDSVGVWDVRTGARHGADVQVDGPSSVLGGEIQPVVFSPDSRLLAVSLASGAVALIEVAAMRPFGPAPLDHGPKEYTTAGWLDPNRLVTVAFDRESMQSRLWDVHAGTLVGDVHTLDGWLGALHTDGRTAWTKLGGLNVTLVWDAATGAQLWTHTAQEIGGVGMHVGADRVAVFPREGRGEIRDKTTGAVLSTFESSLRPMGAQAVVSADWGLSAWVSGDEIVVHDLANGGTQVSAFTIGARPTAIHFTADGRRLIVLIHDTVHVWDPRAGSEVAAPVRSRARISSVLPHPVSSNILAVVSADGAARLWDVDARPLEHRVIARGEGRMEAALNENAGLLAVTAPVSIAEAFVSPAAASSVRFWSFPSGLEARQPGIQVADVASSIALSPDGSLLAVTSTYNLVQLWDIDDRALVWERSEDGHWFNVVEFSHDGRYVAAAGANVPQSFQGVVYFYDTETGERLDPSLNPFFTVHTPRAFAFSADDSRVVTGTHGLGIVNVWDVASRTLLDTEMRHQGAVTAAEFSPSGETLLTASNDDTAQFWDLTSGAAAGPPMQHAVTVRAAAFRAGGETVVTGADDGFVRFWDAATSRQVGPSLPHVGPVNSVQVTRDGKSVVAASEGEVRVWRLPDAPSTLDEMRRRTWIAVGERLDADGNIEAIPAAEWQELRGSVEASGP